MTPKSFLSNFWGSHQGHPLLEYMFSLKKERAPVGKMQGRSCEDLGKMQGRSLEDLGKTSGRPLGDLGKISGRSREDLGKIQRLGIVSDVFCNLLYKAGACFLACPANVWGKDHLALVLDVEVWRLFW